MKRTILSAFVSSVALLLSGYAQAQAIEAVYSLKFDSTDVVEAALNELFEDNDLRGSKATLYVNDLGVPGEGTHTIVADYDNYAARSKLDKARVESHGWANYVLATQGSALVSADLAIVLEDFGKARHEAGYLVAYTMQVSDAGVYRDALAKMEKAIGNPGVLRLVAVRSGTTDVTHAVLVGASDFAAANEYLDKLYASDAFKTFVEEVGDIRTVGNVAMYRRVGHWGY
jgi:hypothetical protein